MKSNVSVANGNAVASALCNCTSAAAWGSKRSRKSIPVTSQRSSSASACASRPFPHPTTSMFEMPAGCLRRMTPAILEARCESEVIEHTPLHGEAEATVRRLCPAVSRQDVMLWTAELLRLAQDNLRSATSNDGLTNQLLA